MCFYVNMIIMSVINITSEENFESLVIKKGNIIQNKLFIVYFYAEWCGPCKMFSSVYDEKSLYYKDINMYKIDIDILENTASNYGIMSIPTLIVFKKGEEIAREVGVPVDFDEWILSIQSV